MDAVQHSENCFETDINYLQQLMPVIENAICSDQPLLTQHRDQSLLILTMMQNAFDPQKMPLRCSTAETNAKCAETMDILFKLLHSDDQLISYACCQLIKKFVEHPSCQNTVQSCFIKQWSATLSSDSASVLGILHWIDILCDLFNQKCPVALELLGTRSAVGIHITKQWENFLNFVFNSNHEMQQHRLYSNVIVSTCNLWIKLIRNDIHKLFSKECNPVDENIFHLSFFLLEKIKTGLLPQMCLQWCFDVLLECLPYCEYLAIQKVIPSFFHELASRVLCMILKEASTFSDSSEMINPARWLQHCMCRSSFRQGFGGYILDADSSDAGIFPNLTFSTEGHADCILQEGGGIKEIDETVLQKYVLLILKSLAVHVHSLSEEDCSTWQLLNCLENVILSFTGADWVMEMLREQDDLLLEALICLLDVFIFSEQKKSTLSDVTSDETKKKYQPCRVFLQFLEKGGWDHIFLLDLLMSPETCFLLYLTRFLKYILNNWIQWVTACECFDVVGPELLGTGESKELQQNISRSSPNNLCTINMPEQSQKNSSGQFDEQILGPLQQLQLNYSTSEGHRHLDTSSEPQKFDTCLKDSCRDTSSDLQMMKKLVDYSSSESDSDEVMVIDCGDSDCRYKETSQHDLFDGTMEDVERCTHVLERAMATLTQLRVSIDRLLKKNLFPFNIIPLQNLLKLCEENYVTVEVTIEEDLEILEFCYRDHLQ